MLIPSIIALGVSLVTPSVSPTFVRAPQSGDYMYTFRVTESEKNDVTSGTVRIHGDRTRIDMDDKRNTGNKGDYILITDNGTRILSVHPDRKQVDQISAANFEHVIGTALRAVSPLVKFRVINPKISWQRVETGTRMLGYATEHVRITERYDVNVTALGFAGGVEHTIVVSDYWVSPGLDLGRNPLIELLTNASTATAQTDRGFVQQQADVRAEAIQGTPLRTAITTTTGKDSQDSGESGKRSTRTIEITSVRQGAQSAALFEVPSGYRMQAGGNISM